MRNLTDIPNKSVPQVDIVTAAKLVSGVTVVAILYLARDVLIPVCLAVLISFVLAPLAQQLRRRGVPQAPAVVTVVLLTFGAILGVGALGASQLAQLSEKLPQYQENIRNKIRVLKVSTTGSSVVTRATTVIDDLSKEISGTKPQTVRDPSAALQLTGAQPIPVEIHTPNANPLKIATEFLAPVLNPLASTGLVLLLVIFFLLQQQDLRDRVIKLLGTKTLHRTTEAMDEAATRLSRYFFLQTALNAAFGLTVGLGLWIIGVPSPLLWGSFAMLMRFVPYIGSILAAVLPIALAAAVDPGWTMMGWTVALFLIGEPLMGQAIEPQVFGHQTGLSPVAIVTAATFWTWLWGPIGLIVATPLTLCLVILGQYTKRLEFLHVLLGDQPALTPPESFYQRLIAGDPAELVEQAERQLKDIDLPTYFDDVAIPGLVLAQRDVTSGELSLERQELVLDGVRDLVDGLPSDDPAIRLAKATEPPADGAEQFDQAKAPPQTVPALVLCVSGRGAVDQAAALLLVHLLDRTGIAAELGPDQGVRGLASGSNLAQQAVSLVCVSYVGQARASHVRFISRRLHRTFPAATILIGGWQMPSADPEWQLIKDGAPTTLFATTLREAVALCVAHAGNAAATQRTPSPDSAVVKHPAPRAQGYTLALSAQGGTTRG
jgi:predicted PurR-regulated permease PerM